MTLFSILARKLEQSKFLQTLTITSIHLPTAVPTYAATFPTIILDELSMLPFKVNQSTYAINSILSIQEHYSNNSLLHHQFSSFLLNHSHEHKDMFSLSLFKK